MRNKIFQIFCGTTIIFLAGCNLFQKEQEFRRETIFDKIVNIETDIIKDLPYLPPLCDKISNLKKGDVPIKDGKLYYEEEGQGLPLVLINGGPGGTHHVFHPEFSQLKDVARIIYYDQRGTGKSSHDPTGNTYTIKQAIEDLDELRKTLGFDRWVVLGWSYGGLLAQCYTLAYPKHVSGLVLVASSEALPSTIHKRSRTRLFLSQEEQDTIKNIWSKLEAGELTLQQSTYNAQLNGDWKRQNYYKPTQSEIIRSTLYEWQPAQNFRTFIGSEQQKINLHGLFDDFKILTIIFEGRWDLTWDTDKFELMQKNHPHAKLHIFEKSGHRIFGDEQEKFFTLVRTFLKKAAATKETAIPGKKITWPQPISDIERQLIRADALPKEEKDKQLLNLYKQALEENSKQRMVWIALANYFIKAQDHAEELLHTLQKLENSIQQTDSEHWKRFGYVIKAWQGHMLDLLGRRNEAIQHYKKALKINNGQRDNYFGATNIYIDQKWLENRLNTPFQEGLRATKP